MNTSHATLIYVSVQMPKQPLLGKVIYCRRMYAMASVFCTQGNRLLKDMQWSERGLKMGLKFLRHSRLLQINFYKMTPLSIGRQSSYISKMPTGHMYFFCSVSANPIHYLEFTVFLSRFGTFLRSQQHSQNYLFNLHTIYTCAHHKSNFSFFWIAIDYVQLSAVTLSIVNVILLKIEVLPLKTSLGLS